MLPLPGGVFSGQLSPSPASAPPKSDSLGRRQCSPSPADDIRKEAQRTSLIDHPNVIRAYCSFVVDHNPWVVMPYMAEGSCLHLMKVAYPDGLEEPVIGSILKETFKALEYLHRQGHIHQDAKVSFSNI